MEVPVGHNKKREKGLWHCCCRPVFFAQLKAEVSTLYNVIEHCITFFLNCITLFINPITLFEHCKTIIQTCVTLFDNCITL